MNVVVIAPHPDDEAIGCGGAICLHVARGDRVAAVFLTSGELGVKGVAPEEACRLREREAEGAADVLGISALTFLRYRDCGVSERVSDVAARLRPVLEAERPQVIYLPHQLEGHPDHRAALSVARAALEASEIPSAILRTYEVWTPLADYDDGEDISLVITRKVRAVRKYRSQIEQLRYDRAVRGLNQYRGATAWGSRYAEVFQHAYYVPRGHGAEGPGVGANR